MQRSAEEIMASRIQRTLAVSLACVLPLLPLRAQAADARIAVATETTSLDPQFHNVGPNNATSHNVFDTLIAQDERQRLQPALALSWTPIASTQWEIKLRPGVLFSDGTPFTADDAVFSLERASKVPNSPSSFAMYAKSIRRSEAIDPLTVRIETGGPAPLLPNDLSALSIVSRHAASGRTTADFNGTTAAIGTGPYRYLSWDRGSRLLLARNDRFWGRRPDWDHVTIRPISNGAARVAALLSGDVDLIDFVPSDTIVGLKADSRVNLFSTDSNRLIFILLDSSRDQSPGVLDPAGVPLTPNPLRDRRVREAISAAINRDALVARLLNGQGTPAGQLLPPGFFGTSGNLTPPKFDPARARDLLTKAGYPKGFGLVLVATNDRYPKDVEIAQGIAQMLTRIGIAARVDTMPASMLFTRGSRLEFSAMVLGWIAASGEVTSPMVALLATYDAAKGFGSSNRGRYSNPEFDRLLEEGLQTLDASKRGVVLSQATEIAMRDVGLVPLYFLVNTWATRKGFAYDARSDEMTTAAGLTPVR